MTRFIIGDKPTFTTTFTIDDENTDPTAVTVEVRDPDGIETTPTPTNSPAGAYWIELSLTKVGRWYVRMTGTGDVEAAEIGYVDVDSTPFD